MKKIIGNKIGNVVNLLIDGNAYQKTFQNQDEANSFFKLMQKARTGDETALNDLLSELNRRYKTVIKGVLEKDSSDNYFLKGIDIKLPEMLANTFVDYLENNYPIDALSNFWKLLVTNPDPRVREDLFKFLQLYNFAITDKGYFIAYKAVEFKEKSQDDLVAFITNQYLKIKKQKKNAAHYEVVKVSYLETVKKLVSEPNPEFDSWEEEEYNEDEDETYLNTVDNGEPEYIEIEREVNEKVYANRIVKSGGVYNDFTVEKIYGNLSELFKNIDTLVEKRSVYQSKHIGKNGKIEQVLGVPVKMDRVETDLDPKVECSSGLHVGSTKYVESFSGQGDAILLVLVNPAHVVAVPEYDNSKIRTCEYFPYAELERNPETREFEVIEDSYFEDDYMAYELTQLEADLNRLQGISKPTQSQEDYKKLIQDRVISIKSLLAKD
jgi:hypothetical protein